MSEAAPSKWLSDWKASLVIDVLVYLFLFIMGGYYSIVTKKPMLPVSNPKMVIVGVVSVIALSNYFVFNYQDRWRKYVGEFDAYPKKEKRIGNIIAAAIVAFILLNLLVMFFMLSRINWARYR